MLSFARLWSVGGATVEDATLAGVYVIPWL
jgi:hypothetical protein